MLLILNRPPPSAQRSGLSIARIVEERARKWTTPGGPQSLWEEANENAAKRARLQRPHPPETEEEVTAGSPATHDFGTIQYLLPSTQGYPLTERAVRHAEVAATLGEYSRSCARLSAQPQAIDNARTHQILRDLHPRGCVPTYQSSTVSDLNITGEDVATCIAKFRRGAAPGPSGWRPDHLLALIKHPGSSVAQDLAPVIKAIANNELDPTSRLAMFSARLFALEKANGGVRPIACGETLRRLTGKILLQQTRGEVTTKMMQHRQVAVGVKNGTEAIIHAARHTVRHYSGLELPHRKIVVKTDLRNAFNLCSREQLLRKSAEILPNLHPYLTAAYGSPTELIYNNQIITSEVGTQQGCPLGPLGFAIVLAAARERIDPAVIERLDLEGWYADDSNIGGDLEDVRAYIEQLAHHGKDLGIEIQERKTTVYCNHDLFEEVKAKFHTEAVFPFDMAETLGAPIGDSNQVRGFTEKLVEESLATWARISRITHIHKAASVLAFCGRGVATHLCRTTIPPKDLIARLDDGLVDTACSIYGVPATPEVKAQLQAKYSEGGFGYRPLTPYADVAYLASLLEAAPISSTLTSHPTLAGEQVTEIIRRINDNNPTLGEIVKKAFGTDTREGKKFDHMQREWAQILDEASPATPTDTLAAARWKSCGGSHLNTHPIISHGDDDPWLTNPQLTMTTRLRLGLQVYPQKSHCTLCRNSERDEDGKHTLSCMGGGHRIRLHNAARDDLVLLASSALANPTVESHCFPHAQSKRADILLNGHSRGGRKCAVDYACINITPARSALAAKKTGGAATAYEAIKREEYGALAEAANLDLVPMCQDVFGAWGDAADKLLRELSHRVANRSGANRSQTHRRTHLRLLARHQRRIADLLLLNSG